MTPVIFEGTEKDVGKILKIKINNSNRNYVMFCFILLKYTKEKLIFLIQSKY